MTTEIWKDIQGYEGIYQVSNLGRVKSLPRYIPDNPLGSRSKELILKPDVVTNPTTKYKRVTLSKKGVTQRIFIHRLVASAFIPNPDNKPYVNHIDNNGENNQVTNLEWVTGSENMNWSAIQGRQDIARDMGIKAASDKAQARAVNRWKARLGDRFLDTYVQHETLRGMNLCTRYVKYRCKNCQKIYDSPAKSKSLSDLNGLCEECFAKEYSEFMEALRNK